MFKKKTIRCVCQFGIMYKSGVDATPDQFFHDGV